MSFPSLFTNTDNKNGLPTNPQNIDKKIDPIPKTAQDSKNQPILVPNVNNFFVPQSTPKSN